MQATSGGVSGENFGSLADGLQAEKILEFHFGWGLVGTDAAGGDVGHVVILGAHGSAGVTSQDRDLPDVGQRICVGCLK
jgi:hypothetical protein